MSGWRRPPLRASLGGTEFECENIEDTTSRALVVHAYPDQDEADLEDCGGEPDSFRVAGFVSGPDMVMTVEYLRASVRGAGRVAFVHPFVGVQYGRVREFTTRRSAEQLDYASISFTFVVGQVRSHVFAVSATSSPGAAASAVKSATSAATAALAAVES